MVNVADTSFLLSLDGDIITVERLLFGSGTSIIPTQSRPSLNLNLAKIERGHLRQSQLSPNFLKA